MIIEVIRLISNCSEKIVQYKSIPEQRDLLCIEYIFYSWIIFNLTLAFINLTIVPLFHCVYKSRNCTTLSLCVRNKFIIIIIYFFLSHGVKITCYELTKDQGQIEYRSRIKNWRILWVTSPGDSGALSQYSYIGPAELRKLHSQTCILEMLPRTI